MWDIGLTHRRAVGHIYSSKFLSDDGAEVNSHAYLGPDANHISTRKIAFKSGHRQQFWKGNCVAVVLSAGLVEPLEASAIMLVEIPLRTYRQIKILFASPPNALIIRSIIAGARH